MYWIAHLDDSYTTGTWLGRLRHDLHMGARGSAHPMSAEVALQLNIQKHDVGKYEYHAFKIHAVKNSLFGLLVGAHWWFDYWPVTILLTLQDIGTQQQRLRQQWGKKSTNEKKAREGFGNLLEIQMIIPLYIDDYNHNRGGVDIADQMCSYYDIKLTAFRTWCHTLFSAYHTMVTNAYFIYKDVPQSSNTITHKNFHLQCTWMLIMTGNGLISTAQIVWSTRAKSTWLNVKEGTCLPLDRSCECGHYPVHLEEGKWFRCWHYCLE